MSDLIFIMAPVKNMEAVGISVKTQRRNLNGDKAIMHLELIEENQLLALVKLGRMASLKGEWLDEILDSKEWKHKEKI